MNTPPDRASSMATVAALGIIVARQCRVSARSYEQLLLPQSSASSQIRLPT
jgi:hypothetical protein